MNHVIGIVLIVLGTFFTLVAALGVIRMPDLFLRMSATTKAATFGATLILTGTALHFGEVVITVRVLVMAAFLLLTAPIAAHMIGRAAYFGGVKLWKGTLFDNWGNRCDDDAEDPDTDRRRGRASHISGQDIP